MFRRKVLALDDVVNKLLREESLEMPLLQRRVIGAWGKVTNSLVEKYTGDKFIKNQTLFVKILNPALRDELGMMKTDLVRKLNQEVGSQVITDLRLY